MVNEHRVNIDRLTLPRPPAGVEVDRGPGAVCINVAGRSAWRWPLRIVGLRTAVFAAAFLLFSTLLGVLAASPAGFGSWVAGVAFALGAGGLLYALVALGISRLILRGPTSYRLKAGGITQTFASGRWRDMAGESAWERLAPDPARAERALAAAGTLVVRFLGKGVVEAAQSARSLIGLEVAFTDVGVKQAWWLERVIRRATRPVRKATRRRIGASRGGEAVCFEHAGSMAARVLISAFLVVALALAAAFTFMADAGGARADFVELMALVAWVWALLAVVGWAVVNRTWPSCAPQRLRVTSAAVAVGRGRFFGGIERRRARLEEVRAVEVERRHVLIHLAGGAVRAPAPLRFRVPKGWRPDRFADEMRQILGLIPADRGFPVVVRGEGRAS